jgi:hypothetical protein
MKLNLYTPVLDFEGKTIPVEGEENKVTQFIDIVKIAITMSMKDEVEKSEEKVKTFQLGIKLLSKKLAQYDLTTDQVAFLTARIDKLYGALVVGRWKELIGDLKVESVDPKEDKENG